MSLSVITPTYNRRHTLHRVKDSLDRQETTDFEWIVVDDGSTDGTADLVGDWQRDSRFPIRYWQRPHNGRNAAVNFAKTQASAPYLVLMDSDDAFTDDALRVIAESIERYFTPSNPGLAAIAFPYEDEKGNRLCKGFQSDIVRCTYLEAYFVHRLRGEFLYVYDRNSYDEVRYIELPPPFHAPISAPHARADQRYIFLDRVLGCRYRHDGEKRIIKTFITGKAGRPAFARRARYRYIWCLEALNHRIGYFRYDRPFFWKIAVRSVRLGLYFRIPLSMQYRKIAPSRARSLWLLALPLGLAISLIDLARYGRADRRWEPESAVNY